MTETEKKRFEAYAPQEKSLGSIDAPLVGVRGFGKAGPDEQFFDQLWNGVVDLFDVPPEALRQKESDGGNPHVKWLHGLFSESLLFPAPGKSVAAASVVNAPAAPVEPAPVLQRVTEVAPVARTAEEPQVAAGIEPSPAAPSVDATPPSSDLRYVALSGGPSQVLLHTQSRVRELGEQPAELLAFLAQAVAPALTRLEKDEQASPETLADVVILALSGNALQGTALARQECVVELVAHIRSLLETQEARDRGDGYFKTRGALPQWLQRIDALQGSPSLKRRIVFYYHELLAPGLGTKMSADTFSIAANNICGALSGLWNDRAEGARARLLSRIQALATVVRLGERMGQEDRGADPESVQALFSALGLSVGQESVAVLDQARALLVLANIPTAWRVVDPVVLGGDVADAMENGDAWMALMGLAAAVLRMALNSPGDWDEIPASFFNAGVALNRWTAVKETDAGIKARAALNATGLVWALERGKDWQQALDSFHGIDCAVNFFGALVDEAERQTGSRPVNFQAALRRVAAGLLAARDRLPEHRQIEFERLRASWERLGIGSLNPMGVSSGRLLEDLDVLLKEAGMALSDDKAGKAVDEEGRRTWQIDTAKRLAGYMQSALGGKEAYQGHADNLSRLLVALAKMAQNPSAAWTALYGDLVEVGVGAGDNEDETGRLHAGPLVFLGEMTRDEWRKEAAAAVPLWQQGYFGDWLQDFLRTRS